MTWRHQAACVDNAPNPLLFTGNENGNIPAAWIDEAKTVCSRCLVADECLEYAIVNHEPFGIWGGHTVDEIAVKYRRRRGHNGGGRPLGKYARRRCDDCGRSRKIKFFFGDAIVCDDCAVQAVAT